MTSPACSYIFSIYYTLTSLVFSNYSEDFTWGYHGYHVLIIRNLTTLILHTLAHTHTLAHLRTYTHTHTVVLCTVFYHVTDLLIGFSDACIFT